MLCLAINYQLLVPRVPMEAYICISWGTPVGLWASQQRAKGSVTIRNHPTKNTGVSHEQLAEIYATNFITVKTSQYVNLSSEKITVKTLSVQAADVQSYTSYHKPNCLCNFFYQRIKIRLQIFVLASVGKKNKGSIKIFRTVTRIHWSFCK